MKSVLLLSTYPFQSPRHGGQVRIANIAKAYRDAGWLVKSIAIYEPETYPRDSTHSDDIEFPTQSEFRQYQTRNVPLITDLLSGKFAEASTGAFDLVLKQLPPKLDAIHVEQPWLWPLVEKLVALPQYASTCTIYGSQNIEAPLKQEILESYNVSGVDDVLEEIEALEHRAAMRADVTLAVTKSDLDIIMRWGAARVILAPNGIAPWSAAPPLVEKWREKLPKTPWILYVASAHPPNFTGFNECINDSLACIPPSSKLVVAGSVGEHLANALAKSRWSSLNLSRLQLLYVLADDDLAAVKTLAHAFLLPIPHGGGSNIKSAEAIYSGKYVIGTPAAFRGFEQHISLPEICIARSPSEFHRAIRTALTSPVLSSQKMGSAGRDSLTWTHCLAEVPVVVSGIISEKSRS